METSYNMLLGLVLPGGGDSNNATLPGEEQTYKLEQEAGSVQTTSVRLNADSWSPPGRPDSEFLE